MKRILIVEDDVSIGNMVQEVLERAGYAVSRAYSGSEALLVLRGARPDLVLLDLMLPGISGESLLPALAGIPVIVVSAKSAPEDKIALLLGGADDYMTKPFDTGELLARIAARLRGVKPGGAVLVHNGIRLDPVSREVFYRELPVHLTRTEFAILKLLLGEPGRAVAKSAILERIAADTPDCTESSLKMHVSNLRRKLREAGAGDCVESIWGIGFRLI